MEMAIVSSISSLAFSFPKPPLISTFASSSTSSSNLLLLKKTLENRLIVDSLSSYDGGLFGITRRGVGADLLERPAFDQSQFDLAPQVEEGGDIGRRKNKRGIANGDSYRVLLIDDERHTELLVAKVLPHIIPYVTPTEARKLFHESRQSGAAIVIVTVKEHAEFYADMMFEWGLRSAIEPDSDTA